MSQTNRLFIASPLPTDLLHQLLNYRNQYQDPAIRLVPEQNLHLTLFFMGNTPAAQTSEILTKLEQIAKNQAAFKLILSAIEAGPNPKHPRLIWARFEKHPEFTHLSAQLQDAFSQQPSGKQKPIPHITLARLKKDKKPELQLPVILPDKQITYQVNEVALWKSTLQKPHPEYTILQKFALNA